MRAYIEETGLPFNILVDESRDVLKAYGVWHAVGLAAWNIATAGAVPDRSVRFGSYSFVAERQHEFPTHAEIMAAIDRLEIEG